MVGSILGHNEGTGSFPRYAVFIESQKTLLCSTFTVKKNTIRLKLNQKTHKKPFFERIFELLLQIKTFSEKFDSVFEKN